ncbi:FecR family protein [Pedobacter nutrimenti]|uniref:FecR family protein n=1 Tax=Pedobacter nutrimenti TaxID=1241337 RepID=A0A318UB66_9SPHI|nr:FecR family protein [Pedobacter nutrimenti]PYF69396.1 FecR family protein [Pedobacter nutrimenti]
MQAISELFHRYLNNQCTAEEVKILLTYFGENKSRQDLEQLILSQLNSPAPEGFEERPEVVALFKQTDLYLNNEIFNKKEEKKIRFPFYKGLVIAASVALLFSVSLYLYIQSKKPHSFSQSLAAMNVKPGTDKATLTLADGTTVILGTDDQNAVLNDKGIRIKKTKDGTLVYEIQNQAEAEHAGGYNELSTPRGAKYQVLLPDGTKVWLNASSTLRYPLVFAKAERRVELKGEGYFEVEKVFKDNQRIPFYVETPKQIIQVLGTEFNISAYDDDAEARTTLVSGKVNVWGRKGNEHEILNPGEQAISVSANSIEVIKVNPEISRAWKNGNFMFEDMYLKDILKQVSRWYNVEIDYEHLPQTRYNALVSRSEPLSNVLRMLEKTGNIKFKLTNNVIKVTY